MTQGADTPPYTQGFVDSAEQRRHFNLHGSELGITDEQEYVNAADNFLGRPPRRGIQQCTRPQGSYTGDIVRWNPATGEFGVLTADGLIRTYFKLNLRLYRRRFPTDTHYFREQ